MSVKFGIASTLSAILPFMVLTIIPLGLGLLGELVGLLVVALIYLAPVLAVAGIITGIIGAGEALDTKESAKTAIIGLAINVLALSISIFWFVRLFQVG